MGSVTSKAQRPPKENASDKCYLPSPRFSPAAADHTQNASTPRGRRAFRVKTPQQPVTPIKSTTHLTPAVAIASGSPCLKKKPSHITFVKGCTPPGQKYHQSKFKEELTPPPSAAPSEQTGSSFTNPSAEPSTDSASPTDSSLTDYQFFPRYSLPPEEHKEEQLRVLQRLLNGAHELQKPHGENERMLKEGMKLSIAERRQGKIPAVLDAKSLKVHKEPCVV